MTRKKCSILFTILLISLCILAGCTSNRLTQYITVPESTVSSHAQGLESEEISESQSGSNFFRTTNLELDNMGNLHISRAEKTGESMGDKGTWTIMVYMCGSDLESDAACASADIKEMCKAVFSDDITLLMQTGGTRRWRNAAIDAKSTGRYEITDGELKLLENQKKSNMGEKETLSDFLRWGIESYPSEKMGLIFWNHGSGSINGVCFDELYGDDSLTLMEIEQALASVNDAMTVPFEFIGFDACLMATLETANILAPHSRYMIASEELASGIGWDYEDMLNYLEDHPDTDGAGLGKVICDGYYEDCKRRQEEDEITLSVLDLTRLDPFLEAFHQVAEEMRKADKATLAKLSRAVYSSESYGGNNVVEGYSNMVDVGEILRNSSNILDSASAAYHKLRDVVVYQVKGENCSKANGVSIYYPLHVESANELKVLEAICVSPAYLGFVEQMAYGSRNGSLAGYESNDWCSGFWEEDGSGGFDWDSLFEETEEGGALHYLDGDSGILMEAEPYVDDEGSYTMVIAQDSLDLVQNVYFSLFAGDGQDTVFYLGKDSNLFFDFDTGEVYDNFWGYWPALPDGQLLTMRIFESTDTYNMYTAPVLLNGEEMSLRIKWIWNEDGEEGEYIVTGAREGLDASGSADKKMVKIRPGDVIVPIYEIYNKARDDFWNEYGEEYVVDSEFLIEDYELPENDYYYSYEVIDIFGTSYFTEEAVYNIDEDGELWYYTD